MSCNVKNLSMKDSKRSTEHGIIDFDFSFFVFSFDYLRPVAPLLAEGVDVDGKKKFAKSAVAPYARSRKTRW